MHVSFVYTKTCLPYFPSLPVGYIESKTSAFVILHHASGTNQHLRKVPPSKFSLKSVSGALESTPVVTSRSTGGVLVLPISHGDGSRSPMNVGLVTPDKRFQEGENEP